MIEKMEMGKSYILKGYGLWASVTKDVYVASIIQFADADLLMKAEIEKTWFTEYEIDPSVYRDILTRNPHVYICKEIMSRQPISINMKEGEFVFIFQDMVNLAESQEIIRAEKYVYTISTGPYTDEDMLHPYKLEQDLINLLNTSLRPFVFDSVVLNEEPRGLFIGKDDYTKLSNSRFLNMRKFKQDTLSIKSNESEKVGILNSKLLVVDDTLELVNKKLTAAKRYFSDATRIKLQTQYREVIINNRRAKLAQVYSKIVEINNQLDDDIKLNLPATYEIFEENPDLVQF